NPGADLRPRINLLGAIPNRAQTSLGFSSLPLLDLKPSLENQFACFSRSARQRNWRFCHYYFCHPSVLLSEAGYHFLWRSYLVVSGACVWRIVPCAPIVLLH